ncbi:MAG: RadC family protein [Bdellovibrionales bacterium]
MSAEQRPLLETTEKPHYGGHRARLRERFLKGGADSLADYELLELLLFMAIPRRDVKPLAKALLAQFGSLQALMAATPHELMRINGVSENTAAALKAVHATAARMMKQDIQSKPLLNNWSRMMDYCYATMAHEKKEHFRVLFMNKKNELLADEIQSSGTVDHTPAYPREIVKRALELGATAMVLMHNHPSGDPKPSQADVDMTRQIIHAAAPLNIIIHDHIIISKNGYTSFKNQGLM